jgi:FdhD protein
MQAYVKDQTIISIHNCTTEHKPDLLAIEEPLEIRIHFGSPERRQEKSISVTMRTPGHDHELVAGFLFTESIIASGKDLIGVRPCLRSQKENGKDNVWIAELGSNIMPDIAQLERHFYTSSSCGVCGKSSIDAVFSTGCQVVAQEMKPVSGDLLQALPGKLRDSQFVFKHTGGLHAAALFKDNGELMYVREDVGRHNALDKLIGKALLENKLPLQNKILLLSGRISFELVQKAARAGIELIAAIGAPSSLAVELGEAMGITLVGFLREDRFNIYSHRERISLPAAVTQKQ